jgi:hypothetical protein
MVFFSVFEKYCFHVQRYCREYAKTYIRHFGQEMEVPSEEDKEAVVPVQKD